MNETKKKEQKDLDIKELNWHWLLRLAISIERHETFKISSINARSNSISKSRGTKAKTNVVEAYFCFDQYRRTGFN